MFTKLQVGIIGIYNGQPMDFLLPIFENNEHKKTVGHCFHIYNLAHTKLLLFSKMSDGQRRTAFLDIGTSCKMDRDISLSIVKQNEEFFLRAYTDADHQGLYRLPYQLTE